VPDQREGRTSFWKGSNQGVKRPSGAKRLRFESRPSHHIFNRQQPLAIGSDAIKMRSSDAVTVADSEPQQLEQLLGQVSCNDGGDERHRDVHYECLYPFPTVCGRAEHG